MAGTEEGHMALRTGMRGNHADEAGLWHAARHNATRPSQEARRGDGGPRRVAGWQGGCVPLHLPNELKQLPIELIT